MNTPLRILHLEDDANDAELALALLEADGIPCVTTRVEDRGSFLAALEGGAVDLVFSDFTMPHFDGLSAVELVRERWPDLPVILISGTIGEEQAIDALKCGATDYVLKHRPSRLVPAVRRAMREVEATAERRRLEAQFIEAQKMEVVGQLAGGVAHDFNNILGVIIGYSDLLSSQLGEDNPLLRYTEEIRHASSRAAGLTRQLLVFSSKEVVHPSVLDLRSVVGELEPLLRRLIDENIGFAVVPGEPVGCILADSGYIGQVLMNLVVNARDAMPNGGKLAISVEDVSLEEDQVGAHPKGDFVALKVADTGAGMTDEVKRRLFDAFFTTKDPGKGTGLGLATCQTIVRQSGGFIHVQSELGQGAAFTIYFPRVKQPLAPATPAGPSGPLPRGSETLLVVEDEPAVRRLALSVLEAQGYTVLSASNGREALHVAREHRGPRIRLVVTDVVMPLMGGRVMAEWLRTADPEIQVLFTSGHTEDAIAHQGVLDLNVEFMPKPYTPGTMIRRVRQMLDRPMP